MYTPKPFPKENGLIIGIETSCDETSVAVLRGGREILSNIIASQIPVHRRFGGVVPEIASRRHTESIVGVFDEALQTAGVAVGDIDGVAVTAGPGLVGALLVGVSFAKFLSYARRIPCIGVNHLEGHIYANLLANPDLQFPFLCLVVSGGHTDLIEVQGHGRMRLLGRTRDDAAGEAFDKVARALGLPYPGGPQIDRLAREGNPEAVSFPRARLDEPFDFSFSGLKSAVLNYLHRAEQAGEPVNRADVAASFQRAVVTALAEKTALALQVTGAKRLALAGGVSANGELRRAMAAMADSLGVELFMPPPVLCTDNGAMIACAGYYHLLRGETSTLTLNAEPNLPLTVE